MVRGGNYFSENGTFFFHAVEKHKEQKKQLFKTTLLVFLCLILYRTNPISSIFHQLETIAISLMQVHFTLGHRYNPAQFRTNQFPELNRLKCTHIKITPHLKGVLGGVSFGK